MNKTNTISKVDITIFIVYKVLNQYIMLGFKILHARKRIALIAHDNKKLEMTEWAIYNKLTLSRHEQYATATAGKLIEEALDIIVCKLLSGPLGGDLANRCLGS